MLVASLPAIADGMAVALRNTKAPCARRRRGEAILKCVTKAATEHPARAAGLVAESTERTIRPREWPRVGPVDLVYSPAATAGSRPVPAAAFVELKWGAKNALWNCIWDIAKCALVNRLGLAGESLLLVGFHVDKEWRHPKYGRLLKTSEWDTAEFQRVYRSEWSYWARPPAEGELHRTGPYCLPPAFATQLAARHCFDLDGSRWGLAVIAVSAGGLECLRLDDWAQPPPLPAT